MIMYYYKFTATTPYCGTDRVELIDREEPMTQSEIDNLCAELAEENGEMYTHLATGWDDDWESEEDEENYFADCCCECEELTFEQWLDEMDNLGLL